MTIQELMDTLPRPGRLEHITLRTQRRGEVKRVEETEVVAGLGLSGDHRAERKEVNMESKRQVTLIQAEHLPVLSALMGHEVVPEDTRRNLVVSGINLLALKDKRFKIGEVVFEGSGLCHPCSRMEETLGEGGYNVMRGHGGILARVLQSGTIRVGDEVVFLPSETD